MVRLPQELSQNSSFLGHFNTEKDVCMLSLTEEYCHSLSVYLSHQSWVAKNQHRRCGTRQLSQANMMSMCTRVGQADYAGWLVAVVLVVAAVVAVVCFLLIAI